MLEEDAVARRTRVGYRVVRRDPRYMPDDFRCKSAEFADYLGVSSLYDVQERLGRLYWAVHKGETAGYMMLAMGYLEMEWRAGLDKDASGSLPALVITYLATDERHERRGAGSAMVSFAIDLACRLGGDVGCRVVLANSVPDAVEFYKKNGFKIMPGAHAPPGGLAADAPFSQDREVSSGGGLVPMYFDLGPLDMHMD